MYYKKREQLELAEMQKELNSLIVWQYRENHREAVEMGQVKVEPVPL